jgi:hypothetical protein
VFEKHIKISQKLIQPEWRYFLRMKRAVVNGDFLMKPSVQHTSYYKSELQYKLKRYVLQYYRRDSATLPAGPEHTF